LIQAEDGVFVRSLVFLHLSKRSTNFQLAEQYVAGAKISLTFPQSGGAVQFPSPTGGLVSDFTTYGPTNDFYFKPAITAPGGSIVSTFPIPLGTWALLSGVGIAPFFVKIRLLKFHLDVDGYAVHGRQLCTPSGCQG
jgi:hypothetical protein